MQGLQASEAVRPLPMSRAVVPRWGLPVSGAVWFPQGCNEWFWEGLMGFGQLEVEFLLHEHRYQPFVGEALSIGKQAVALKPETMLNLLKAYGIESKNTSFEVDTKNRHNLPGSGWITDESFFASFSECKLRLRAVWTDDIDLDIADRGFCFFRLASK
jgi:hypothetical protein